MDWQTTTGHPRQFWNEIPPWEKKKVVHWGWYYLSTVIDEYSRFILAWRLCAGMSVEDVKQTLDEAIQFTGIRHPTVLHRPRLLSDNGPCYVCKALKEYLDDEGISHNKGKPYHPMTQGKIERYHRSMKNVLLLENYYSPPELEHQIRKKFFLERIFPCFPMQKASSRSMSWG